MSNFLHRWLNPHCVDCNAERQESKLCMSCETLKDQLARVNDEKKQLLESILEKPKEEEPRILEKEEIQSKYVPWRVRQAALEAEDRQKAMLLKKKQEELKGTPKVDTSELEKELEIVEKERINAR